MLGWAPAGFIYQLAGVDLEALYKSRKTQPGPREKGSDRPLYQTLKLLPENAWDYIMAQLTPVPGTKWRAKNLKNLMAALEGMEKSRDWDKPIYTWDVCVEFHHLLLSLLLGYGRLLFRLDDLGRREGQWRESTKNSVKKKKEELVAQKKALKDKELDKRLESTGQKDAKERKDAKAQAKAEKEKDAKAEKEKDVKAQSKTKGWTSSLKSKLGGSSSSEKLRAREVKSQPGSKTTEPEKSSKELEAALAELEQKQYQGYPPQSKDDDERTRKDLMTSVLIYSRLLVVIMSSRLFEEHFQTTLQARPPVMPTPDHGDAYIEWAGFRPSAGESLGVGGARGGGGDGASDTAGGGGDGDGQGGAGGGANGDTDVGEEMLQSIDPLHPFSMFRRWTSLNIRHLHALKMAASLSLVSLPLQFTLLVIERPLVTPTPQSWHTYIEVFLANIKGIDVDDAKEFIQEIIDEGIHEISSQFGRTGATGAQLLLGNVLWNGNLHCEQVLASLPKYPPPEAAAGEGLSEIISVGYDVMLPTVV